MLSTSRVFTIACGFVLLLFLPSLLLAQEWSRFRGNNGEGQSTATTIPVSWTPSDYRWRVELPGMGYSSPVVWGDRVFVTATLEEDATQIVRCLRCSDGGLVWERTFPSITHSKHRFNSYASATPVLDENHVYFAFATPEQYNVLALTQAKGEEVWRRDLGPFISQHGFGASPILVDELLILPNDQDAKPNVVALDRNTGATRWEGDRRAKLAAFATPCLYRPPAGPPQLIFSSSAHGVNGIDPTSGKSLWEVPVFKSRVVGSPIVASGLIFASAGSGGIGREMFAFRPGNPSQGVEPEVAYSLEKGSLPYVPTPVTHGNLVFLWFDKGVVTCLDAPTGEVVWRERIGGDYFGSPVRVNDRLYCISREGEMVVLSATKEFKELARIDLEERSNSTPAVSDGVMYLRTVGHLMAIGGKQ